MNNKICKSSAARPHAAVFDLCCTAAVLRISRLSPARHLPRPPGRVFLLVPVGHHTNVAQLSGYDQIGVLAAHRTAVVPHRYIRLLTCALALNTALQGLVVLIECAGRVADGQKYGGNGVFPRMFRAGCSTCRGAVQRLVPD